MTMSQYYGLLGIGLTIVLTVIVCIWLDYFSNHMKDDREPYDEYEVEQARLSWEARKSSYKASKLTAINAARGEKT